MEGQRSQQHAGFLMVDTNGAFSLIVNSVSVIHALLSNTVGKVTCESAAVDVGPDWSGSQIKIRRRVALPEHSQLTHH